MKELVIVSCLMSSIYAYPEGPPLSACTHMFPTEHGAAPQTSDPYFRITVDTSTYTAGSQIQVTLEATSNYYEGVFVQARQTDCANTKPVGTFTLPSGEDFLKTMTCNGVTNGAVAHKKKEHITKKTFTWTAPVQTVGHIYFQGTFVKNEKTFWVGVFSEVIKPSGNTMATKAPCPADTGSGGRSLGYGISMLLSVFLVVNQF